MAFEFSFKYETLLHFFVDDIKSDAYDGKSGVAAGYCLFL